MTFAELVNAFQSAQPQDERWQTLMYKPVMFLGNKSLEEVGPKLVDAYPAWRLANTDTRYGRGTRAVDCELTACSRVYKWALRQELVTRNPFLGRQLCHRHTLRTCREVAPRSGDDVHAIARWLFEKHHKPHAWAFLFLCLTGVRSGELLPLKLDQQPSGQDYPPGWHNGSCFVIHAGKQRAGGRRTRLVTLTPESVELMKAWKAWIDSKAIRPMHWFPSHPLAPISARDLKYWLDKATAALSLPHITIHGCRSYFCQALRCQEPDDRKVCDALGHSSPAMLWSVYGQRMPDTRISFLPSAGDPAWVQEKAPSQS